MQKSKEDREGIGGLVIHAAIGGIIALAMTLALLFVVAVLITAEVLPESMGEEITVVAALISATAGAFIAARRRGSGAIPTGICSGLCFFLLIIVITSLRRGTDLFGVMTVKLLICSLSGGTIGGLLSTAKKHKRRTIRK